MSAMHRVLRVPFTAVIQGKQTCLTRSYPRDQQHRGLAKATTSKSRTNSLSAQSIPHLIADHVDYAQQPEHVEQVQERLEHDGILKISLRFPDSKSQYLQSLVVSLNKNHGHGLPITHSASQGWFWDVRPSQTSFQTEKHQARSETMEDFPWHTDCSYDSCPPRFFALHVLQHDRYGGGTLSVMKVQHLSQFLSADARDNLARPEYMISIPPEFIKDPAKRHIVGSIMTTDHKLSQWPLIRFRGEIVTPLSDAAARALDELKDLLRRVESQADATLHLKAADLPRNSIILLDNYRWLHARNYVKDPSRHLRRVRWDAVPFPNS